MTTPTLRFAYPTRAYVLYAEYVERNLERISSDGFVPVCLAEFVGSEECDEVYWFRTRPLEEHPKFTMDRFLSANAPCGYVDWVNDMIEQEKELYG
jgi:hypothetical protein